MHFKSHSVLTLIVPVVLAGFVLVACGPSDDAIRSMIKQELSGESPAAEGASKSDSPKKSATGTQKSKANKGKKTVKSDASSKVPSSMPEEIVAKLQDSVGYFKKLTELMADYKPELPEVVDNTDLLRCATKETISLDSDMSKLDKSLVKERKNSEKERKNVRREFYRRVYPVNFRIDHDWQSRPGLVRKKVYGCWDYDDYRWVTSEYSTRGSCLKWGDHRWRVRSSKWVEDESINRYSGTATPDRPELMKRVSQSGVVTPERHYCSVRSVRRKEKKKSPDIVTIGCGSIDGNDTLTFVIKTVQDEPTGLQRGDVISVPQGTATGLEPSLVYADFDRSSWGLPELNYWVLNVKQGGLRKEVTRSDCPDATEIAAALCRIADRKSSPAKVVANCALAKDLKRLKEFVGKWEKKRRMKGKATVLAAAYTALLASNPDDYDATIRLATYQLELKQNEQAKSNLESVVASGTTVKQMLLVTELAGFAKFDALKKSALTKACNMGEKNACALLEKLAE